MIKSKNYKLYIFLIFLLVIVFYYQMVQSGISTHDELLNIYLVRMGEFFENRTWERWGMLLMSIVPSYLHASCTNLWLYKALTLAGILIACSSFGLFIRKVSGNNATFIFFILFFFLGQFENEHNGLYSFSFSYQMNTAYVFIGLSLYYEYLKNRKTRYIIVSAVFYLLSSMAYEAFILYGILFFLIDLYHLLDSRQLSVFNLIKDLWLHATLVIIYFITYVYASSQAVYSNEDATVGSSISLLGFLISEAKLSIGLFPLRYHVEWNYLINESFSFSPENIIRIIIILITSLSIYFLVRDAETINLKTYFKIGIFCIVGMLLPGVLVAMTDKFENWLYRENSVLSFGVSYYSYFFIIAFIGISIIVLYQHVPFKKGFLVLCCIFLGVVAEFTLISNKVYIDRNALLQNKYELFDGVVSSDYFSEIEDEAQIYAPMLYGIHGSLELLDNYASKQSGCKVHFVNKQEDIDHQMNTYKWIFDLKDDVSYLVHLDGSNASNEVYVYAGHNLDGYGLIADVKDNSISPIYVDGRFYNVYNGTIITGNISNKDNSMVIGSRNIIPDSIELYASSNKYDHGAFSYSGFKKKNGRIKWSCSGCIISVDNVWGADKVTLDMLYELPNYDGEEVIISCGGNSYPIQGNGKVSANVDIPLSEGNNEISFCVEGASEDDKKVIRFDKLNLTIADDIIRMCGLE